ncbi:MAG TPA: hypothetical protein VLH10_20845 [Yinghuangia sp.]|nr:hypothetical protein [Yinghuangia sp.]
MEIGDLREQHGEPRVVSSNDQVLGPSQEPCLPVQEAGYRVVLLQQPCGIMASSGCQP